MDVLTPEQRKKTMRAVKSANTLPELIVRKMLFHAGFRFRLHRKDLPGKPDIVLPRYRTVVFVHGCFWHQHPGCKNAARPSSRQEYWQNKLDKNVSRDASHISDLEADRWKVVVVWECETKNPEMLSQRLKAEII
ncbi:very short patch repair endonuclease [Herbaspirillum seropedicae]|uniref:very short patch repair endonuclease n=1 Tax=Herbaspirillum seropedicae TaxID=964 RepID=UPI003F8D5022